jgi:hypothetical protein
MRRGINITVALILIAILIKMVDATDRTVADTNLTTGSIQNTMAIYSLHASHPSMANLPVQDPPQP